MKRGDVVVVRFPHPSGLRGKKRPAVVVQSDSYSGKVGTIIVAEVTKNQAFRNDPSCLFIDVTTPDGKATGLIRDSVVSALVCATVYFDSVETVLGALSQTQVSQLNDCLKAALALS